MTYNVTFTWDISYNRTIKINADDKFAAVDVAQKLLESGDVFETYDDSCLFGEEIAAVEKA